MAQKFRSFGEQTLHYFDRAHTGEPHGPINHPAAWRGDELRSHPDEWTEIITPDEVRELKDAIDRARAQPDSLTKVDRTNFPLPTLSKRIEDWRHTLSDGRGFLLVRGLPVEEWTEDEVALAFWGIGHHLGLPGAQNPDNELLGHVIDYEEEAENPFVRRYRTTGNIDFHCDAADIVGLCCLADAAEGGQSRIASSVSIFNEILSQAPDLASRLFAPFKLDRRGEQKSGDVGYIDITPCCYDGTHLRTFYHSEYFRSAARHVGAFDKTTQAALDLYDELAASPSIHLDMWLQPGDMQFVSNHTNVHARTGYTDHPNRKRHLLRLWLSLE